MTRVRGMLLGCAAIVCAAGAAAQADTYGNTDPFETQSNHSPDFVLGVQVSIPVNDFQLESFGMMYGHESFGDPADSTAVFGLYSSGGDGLPETLLAVTDPISLTAQQTYDSIAFTSAPIVQSGAYWMMALYQTTANPRMSTLDGGSVVAYWSNSYGDGMPSDAPAVTTYTGQNFNYWVNGTVIPSPGALAACGVLGVAASRRRRAG